MQSHMSGAPAPITLPPRAMPVPEVVPAPPKRPKRRGVYLLFTVIGLIILGFVLWRAYVRNAAEQAAAPAAATRTATVSTGALRRAVRLTGTTAAENYVSITAPLLRGGRGGFATRGGGGGGGGSRGGGGSSSGGSSGGGSSSGGSSSGSSTTSGSSASAISSTGGSSNQGSTGSGLGSGGAAGVGSGSVGMSSGAGSTGGFRGSGTNRFGSSGSSSSSGTGSGSTGSTSGTSSVLGADGLGTTSSSLGAGTGGGGGGGGGGSGGGNDFMLVIQSLAPAGGMVKKGDIVAEFDRVNMLNRLDDFRAALTQTEASMRQLEAEIELSRKAHDQKIQTAKAELEKARLEMQTTPVRSIIDAEKLKLNLQEAEAQYKQLLAEVPNVRVVEQAQLRQQQLEVQEGRVELKRLEAHADRMLIKTPINGLTVMQNMFRGTEMSPVQQGDQVFPGMRFMQVVDPSSMVVDAHVNQVDVEQLRVGAKASVRFDAYPGLEIPAKVIAIGAIPRTGGRRPDWVKEIPVRLKLDKLDPRVIPDLSVSVDVEIGSEENATLLPLGGLFRGESGSFVFVRVGNGWQRRPVEVADTNYVAAAVRSGVRPGEVVAAEWPASEPKRK